MREKGQNEAAKTLETPVFSRGIEILTEKWQIYTMIEGGFYVKTLSRVLSTSER